MRMVKSIKHCLRKMVGRCSLSLDELYTAPTEVESILNLRPLTYMSASDIEEPLTLSHLLLGRLVLSMPDHLGVTGDPDDYDFTTTPTQLNDRVKQLNCALNFFWTKCRDEYLLEFREAHKHDESSCAPYSTVSIGNMVVRACLKNCGSLARSMNSLRAETARFGVRLCNCHLELGFYVDQSSCCTHWKCTVITEALLPTVQLMVLERMRWQQTNSRARTRVSKSAQHFLRTRPVIQALSSIHKKQLHSKLEIACWLWLTLMTVDPYTVNRGEDVGTWI